MFLETSALNGENVEEAFLKCTRTILAKIESGLQQDFALLLGCLWFCGILNFARWILGLDWQSLSVLGGT